MGILFSIIANTNISILLFKILKSTDLNISILLFKILKSTDLKKPKNHLKIKESLIFLNNPKSHIKFTNISVFSGVMTVKFCKMLDNKVLKPFNLPQFDVYLYPSSVIADDIKNLMLKVYSIWKFSRV